MFHAGQRLAHSVMCNEKKRGRKNVWIKWNTLNILTHESYLKFSKYCVHYDVHVRLPTSLTLQNTEDMSTSV